MSAFKVQKRQCATCIYRPDSSLSLKKLEADVADPFMKGYFRGHRVCHHSKDVCCRGFWDKHKDQFTLGQIAQRLKMVQFVDVDTLKKGRTRNKPVANPVKNLDPAGESSVNPYQFWRRK